ncbi:MAG: hypothetical protein HC769_08960 [Cyanobacteria bacterium CRU_2_1]|nr:hypothetical protein [Cyanobacteria bacterium RU_5_0]NJR58965.1 hypothetical protein [Cyanobacteria bacterium CRU_2_1]
MSVVKLIYRAQILEYSPRSIRSVRKPPALNWRYRVAGEAYGETLEPTSHYFRSSVVNWRYQMATEV